VSKPNKAWILAGGATIIFLLAKGLDKVPSTKFSFGGKSTVNISRDPSKLLPSFAKKLELVFRAMRARGFDPVLWEGYRARDRAVELALRGTGIADSLHELGAAVDIVDRTKLWNAPKAFWGALREEGERVGLTSGATFSDEDLDHLQAIPYKDQNKFRAMTPVQRERFIALAA
jgi:hypothetical protein